MYFAIIRYPAVLKYSMDLVQRAVRLTTSTVRVCALFRLLRIWLGNNLHPSPDLCNVLVHNQEQKKNCVHFLNQHSSLISGIRLSVAYAALCTSDIKTCYVVCNHACVWLLRCVEYLLDNGADPCLCNSKGYSAVHYAAAHGNKQSLELVSAQFSLGS